MTDSKPERSIRKPSDVLSCTLHFMYKPLAYLIALAVLVLGAFVIPVVLSAEEPVTSLYEESQAQPSAEVADLAQRGKQLRAALDRTYKTLSETNGLKRETVIDDLMLTYIPRGTAIADAERILRNAGFKVDPHPVNPQGTRPDRFDVTASIVPLVDKFPSRTSVYVSMTPESPADYRVMTRLSASIIVSLP